MNTPSGCPGAARLRQAWGSSPASHVAQRTFRTCHCHYPGGRIGCFGCLDRSATAFATSWEARRRVFTFEASSAFTRVAAHAMAPPAYTGVCPELRSGRLPRRTVRVATEAYRQLLGRISHPLAP